MCKFPAKPEEKEEEEEEEYGSQSHLAELVCAGVKLSLQRNSLPVHACIVRVYNELVSQTG